MSKHNFYNITNIKDNYLLIYNFKNNRFQYKNTDDINLNIQNDIYTANFLIKKKTDFFKLYFQYLKLFKSTDIMLVFSSNKIDNPLFFNIIHIINNKYYLLNIKENEIVY